MTRRRPSRPVTVATGKVATCLEDSWRLFDALGAERPATVRVWHRRDGITVRALGRTQDGMKLSVVVKLRSAT